MGYCRRGGDRSGVFAVCAERPGPIDTNPMAKSDPGSTDAVWWQWAFSVPVSSSPLFDDTGVDAYSGQPYSDLLFLCGTFNVTQTQSGDVVGKVTRSISVKQGTAFFFPLINAEWDNTCNRPKLGGNCLDVQPFPTVLGVPKLKVLAAQPVNSVTALLSTLTPTDAKFKKATGPTQNLDMPRLQSHPFSFTLPATDNIYQNSGIAVSGTVAPAVSDGYYSFIPGTLAPGYYLLQFGGSFPINDQGNTFTEQITYQITVTN
jgi:hypothetical protein